MTTTMRFVGFRAVAVLLAVAALSAGASAADERSGKAEGRPAAGKTLPTPGVYEIDSPHTFAYFNARHKVVGLVRGRFDEVSGTVTVAQDPSASAVDISIDAASVSTQNDIRDEDLRGPDFFDAKKFPTITYRGRGIRLDGESWTMDGALTIRGITRVVPLKFVFNGTAPSSPGKPSRVAFHATAGVKRADFGMTRELLEELGASPSAGPDVEIEIDTELLSKEVR